MWLTYKIFTRRKRSLRFTEAQIVCTQHTNGNKFGKKYPWLCCGHGSDLRPWGARQGTMGRWERLLPICDTDDSTGGSAITASMIVNYNIYSIFRPLELAFIHGTNGTLPGIYLRPGHTLRFIGKIDRKRAESVMKVIKEMLSSMRANKYKAVYRKWRSFQNGTKHLQNKMAQASCCSRVVILDW